MTNPRALAVNCTAKLYTSERYPRHVPLIERIERRSMPIPECGCWAWLGALAPNGYGSIHYRGRVWRAHRLSWVAHKGPIPNGLQVLHRCDTPLCVNPDHLFLGSHQENMEDRERKGRNNPLRGKRHHFYGKSPRGEQNPRSKLTDALVREPA